MMRISSSNPELQREAFTKQRDRALLRGGPDSPKVAVATLQLANLLCTLNRPEDELSLREQHLAACRRNVGLDDLGTVQAEMRLASCLVKLERADEADPLLRHVVAIRTAILGSDNPETLVSLSLSANVARKLGRFDEARDLHLKTLEWIESQESVDSVNMASAAMQVGNVMTEWREFEQGSEFYRRALEMRQLALGPDDPDTLSSLRSLALATYLSGQVEVARGLAEELVERSERTRGAEARESIMAQEVLLRIKGHG
jgi:tetratricopeptide (TPR) repeat protein